MGPFLICINVLCVGHRDFKKTKMGNSTKDWETLMLCVYFRFIKWFFFSYFSFLLKKPQKP